MKKQFLVILIFTLAAASCERDDICIDDITPNFTIRFYDSEEPTEFKAINGVLVQIIGINSDTIYSISVSGDSIQLPMRTDFSTTKYSLINQIDGVAIADTITLNYTPEPVFIGRACGFKSIFNDVEYVLTPNNDNWITSIEVVTDNIIDETTAHVKIFH